MIEGLILALFAAALTVGLWFLQRAWVRWQTPTVVHSMKDFPRGINSSSQAGWVHLHDHRDRVMTGPRKLSEWHYQGKGDHLFLVWRDPDS